MALGGGDHRRRRPKFLLISLAFLWLVVSSYVFDFVSCFMLTSSSFVTIGHSHLSSNEGSSLTPSFSVEVRRSPHAGRGISTVSSLHRSKLHQHDLTGFFPVEDMVCVRRSKTKPHISDLSEDLSVKILAVAYRRRIISTTEVLQYDLNSKEAVGKNIYGGTLLVSDSLLQRDTKSSMSPLQRKCKVMYFNRCLLFGPVPVLCCVWLLNGDLGDPPASQCPTSEQLCTSSVVSRTHEVLLSSSYFPLRSRLADELTHRHQKNSVVSRLRSQHIPRPLSRPKALVTTLRRLTDEIIDRPTFSIHCSYRTNGGRGKLLQNPTLQPLTLMGSVGLYPYYCKLGLRVELKIDGLLNGVEEEYRVKCASSPLVESICVRKKTTLPNHHSSVRVSHYVLPLLQSAFSPVRIISVQPYYSRIENFQTAYKRVSSGFLIAAPLWSKFGKCATFRVKHLDPVDDQHFTTLSDDLSFYFLFVIVIRLDFYPFILWLEDTIKMNRENM